MQAPGNTPRGEGVRHRWRWVVRVGVPAALLAMVGFGGSAGAAKNYGKVAGFTLHTRGELDCNGDSPAQHALAKMYCTDIRGFLGTDNQNTWGGRFYDNGTYIGHDEPDATYLSSAPGSGNNVRWTIKLGKDPAATPTGTNPGHDVSHWFELSPAPWFSMAQCDSNSYPQLPCVPRSDTNAPACPNVGCSPDSYPGAGGAFMEMQFYPPGNPPWIDSESCDATHWCAALTIDSLECTFGFAQCNVNCEEPVNFAFIQRDGVPAGPPAPQTATVASFVPNSKTLLMNQGDRVSFHMWDAPAPGGGRAFEVRMKDLTTGQSGWMQASAHNGFQNTSIVDCSGTPHNFQPEYSTAKKGNITPWAALQTNISTEFETGHFEPCTTLSGPLSSNPFDSLDSSKDYNVCHGPYEKAGGPEDYETGDANCYYRGNTHQGYAGPGTKTAPVLITHCQDNVFQNGDLDFDGTPYWHEWPTGTTPNRFPASFVEQRPTTDGHAYPKWFMQTDIALSEGDCTSTDPSSCTVPPEGPGKFYPYWTLATQDSGCDLE
jgi:hypothetical protein